MAGLASAAFAAGAVALLAGGPSRPPRQLASIFEDDNLLVNQPLTPHGDATVLRTLRTLRALGVDRVRVLVLWRTVDPRRRPAAPDSPAGYGPCAWGVYDRLDVLARALGLGVFFDLSDPAPAWAVPGRHPAAFADRYAPSARAFAAFVTAAGRRYDGRFRPPPCPGADLALTTALPRVSFWSVWNEPNQPGWLAPQENAAGVPVAAARYRAYVDAFWRGMTRSGHTPATDTLLIGELAPQGCLPAAPCGYPGGPTERPIPPLTFLRALYCVGPGDVPLDGRAATALGCPARPDPAAFLAAHPGLFHITGFSHHPYSLLEPPTVPSPEPSFVLLADLPRLEAALDAIFRSYDIPRRLPLYLTEFGYVTDPPNRFTGVSLRQQSLFLDTAQYLAWRDPRVRALAQFSLQDNPPAANGSYRGTFQEGLEFLGGRPKPSLPAYRLPFVVLASPGQPALSAPRLRPGEPLGLWAMLRPLRGGRGGRVAVQWRPRHGTYRAIARLPSVGQFVDGTVRVPGTGVVRVDWRGVNSRGAAVTVAP